MFSFFSLIHVEHSNSRLAFIPVQQTIQLSELHYNFAIIIVLTINMIQIQNYSVIHLTVWFAVSVMTYGDEC